MFLLFHTEYQPLPLLAHVRGPFVTIVEKRRRKTEKSKTIWIQILITTDCQWACVTYKQSAIFEPLFDAWLMWKRGLCLALLVI